MDSENLQIIVQFVTDRISAQANYLGNPLNANEQHLLANLPGHSSIPLWRDPYFNELVARDVTFERLCELAKTAIKSDFESGAGMNWMLAAAVLKLHRHPMYWLLQWAGLNARNPWWDRVLLWCAGILVVGFFLVSLVHNEGMSERFTIGSAIGGAVLSLVILHFALQTLEKWQLRRAIQSYKEKLN